MKSASESVAPELFISQEDKFSFRNWLDLQLNDLSTGFTLYLNLGFIASILLSVLCTMFISLPDLSLNERHVLNMFEIGFAVIFSIEYALRLYSAPDRLKYAFSFYGMVDFLAIVPALIGNHHSVVLRLFRLIAVIRLMKLLRYAKDVQVLLVSLKQSLGILGGIAVAILLMATFVGNLVYALEPQNFDSAFEGLWWSLVTMSTVGYGDFVPHSLGGRVVAGFCMLIGIGMFAIITGIITTKIDSAIHRKEEKACPECASPIDVVYRHCPHCGHKNPHLLADAGSCHVSYRQRLLQRDKADKKNFIPQ